ncbi:MAG: ABC transporter ATP-binding protein/permease [Defluviitaleaceae bacterium]|nr:ABC transporter ATP-binding protein/permease [Defluviitaleaceae bacterium]MCL2238623.1 ABC transporter ATP-binding protein/permease [Defluviitaleaceae bacterium]
MPHILPYWRRYQRQIILGMVCLVLATMGDLLIPSIVSRIIDQGVMEGDLGRVLELGGLMLLVTAVSAVFTVVRCIISSRVSQLFGADLRLDLFARINRFSFAAINKQETASLITRMTNDTAQLVSFTNSLMRMFLRHPVLLIGATTMTILLNPRLALVLTGVIPLIALLMYISMKVGFPLFTRLQEALDKNNAVTREYLSGVRVVKAYNTFDQEVARFDVTNTALAATATKAQRVVGIFFPIISFAVNASLVLTLWMAREWVAQSQMQVGQLVAFLNYMMLISMSMGMMFNVYQMFVRARASAARIGEVLEEKDISPLPLAAPPMNPMEKGTGIAFAHVHFAYPGGGDEPVLRDITFSLPGGKTLGIIGSTGAGKSSLVQLIPGLYAPTRGTVRVGGMDTATCDLDALRAGIAYVAQQNTLFYGTIADNIRMGKADATPEEMEAAARAASAHDFIVAYPEGYETVIGQKGVNLSGGQKQRLGIARALVRRAPILVLDDCVSAVDAETEASIMQAIYALSPAPTVVMITQRISSVIHLEHILVMENGGIAGYGAHPELMQHCAVYREIYNSQLNMSE